MEHHSAVLLAEVTNSKKEEQEKQERWSTRHTNANVACRIVVNVYHPRLLDLKWFKDYNEQATCVPVQLPNS